jgi:hypothetical protein
MHLFKQHGVEDHQAAAGQIPVIDYSAYFAGAPGALERVAAEVAHACENIGFFYALRHGVPDELIDRAFAASRRFHAMPLEQKLALKLNEKNIGFLPINASVQGASTVHKATKPNQNESFFVSHDRGPEHPDVLAGKPLRGRNQWREPASSGRLPIHRSESPTGYSSAGCSPAEPVSASPVTDNISSIPIPASQSKFRCSTLLRGCRQTRAPRALANGGVISTLHAW